jgi:hypothetical protein
MDIQYMVINLFHLNALLSTITGKNNIALYKKTPPLLYPGGVFFISNEKNRNSLFSIKILRKRNRPTGLCCIYIRTKRLN